ncbi:MAG: low affinity iron permease family protein [Bdellovibrionales bacterium]|nr:low affinity iron permease family protein [Bdellovibrionales bacterium]
MRDYFRYFSTKIAEAVGTPLAFGLALLTVIVWLCTGPMFHYSDTWQLIINTGTTIITFLMVFLIQNAQNRDTKAVHLKLNELLVGVKGSRSELVDLEEMSDEELETMRNEFRAIHERLHKAMEKRKK